MSTYDYIIIGAGTSGCVLASRLLQNTQATILILEAGIPNDDPIYHISPQYPNIQLDLFWAKAKAGALKFPISQELNGRNIRGMIGWILGGSSTVNGSVFNIPKKVDFSNWSTYSGLPPTLFDKIARNVYSNNIHSTLSTDDVMYKEFIEACNKCHINFIDEYHLKKEEGVSWIQFLHRNDYSRFSTADLLQPFLNDPRLTILTSCNVNRIIIQDKCAKSVECTVEGKTKYFSSNEAIVCSAGTFLSPAILLKSGIGPEGSNADLPGVGKNLRDHFSIKLHYESHNGKQPPPLNDGSALTMALAKFSSHDSCVLPGRLQLYLKSFAHLEYPDIFAEIFCREQEVDIFPMILCPFSSGMVSLESIRYDAFTHPFDIVTMRRTVRIIDKIMSNYMSGSFSSITSHMTDVQIDDFIQNNYCSWTHPVGTCAMGYSSKSVVDRKLQVHHLDKLFIADCSILPLEVHGGTFAAAMCVGEYAAKSILHQNDEFKLPIPKIPSLWQIAGSQKLCSRIAIGLSHFKETPKDFALLDHAIANGCTTFDCAVVYSGIVPFGKWLKQQPSEIRSRLFVIGKGAHPDHHLVPRVTQECILKDINLIFEILGTSYLDCFMLHRDDPNIPVEKIVTWLNHVVSSGLARSYGVSNWTLDRIKQANAYAFYNSLLPIGLVSNYCGPMQWIEPPWHGCVQMSREEARYVANDLGIPILSWSPISPILDAAKNYEEIKDVPNVKSELAKTAIRNIFEINPKVGVVIRTSSLDHLSQILEIDTHNQPKEL